MAMIGRQRKGDIRFNYKCECADCDEVGRLTIKAAERGTIGCPGGCGAAYVAWRGPDGKWRLQNVVMPVYGDPEMGDYVEDDDFEY